MSLGFEVELNHVEVRKQSGTNFGDSFKGVTLFKAKTQDKTQPGVNAVIETGTLGGTSTLELVSNVDTNPYAREPAWRTQVEQIVALVEALSRCTATTSVTSFISQTQTRTQPLNFSPKRTSKDIQARMGPQEVSFLRSLLCCCPPEDQRVADVRGATLTSSGRVIAADCIQVNFSASLAYLGERLAGQHHPFAGLMDRDHAAHEDAVVTAIHSWGRGNNALANRPLLGYLFLVLHRLTFESGPLFAKNRFLFLPRFDLLDIRERLSEEDHHALSRVDLAAFARLRPIQGHLPLTSRFSTAYQMARRDARQVVENTVEEFLQAALHGDLGGRERKVVTEHIMRVPDSTLPRRVEGSDNIVFEGRLGSWTQFAGDDLDLGDLSRGEQLEALRRGLMSLGAIVTGYDVAPRPRTFVRGREDPAPEGGEGMLVPLMEKRQSIS